MSRGYQWTTSNRRWTLIQQTGSQVLTATSLNGFDPVQVDPRGSNRMTVKHNLDLELKKEIRIIPRLSVTPIFSVLNVFSDETLNTYGSTIESTATLRQPTAQDKPRNFQVGFRVDWY